LEGRELSGGAQIAERTSDGTEALGSRGYLTQSIRHVANRIDQELQIRQAASHPFQSWLRKRLVSLAALQVTQRCERGGRLVEGLAKSGALEQVGENSRALGDGLSLPQQLSQPLAGKALARG